MAGGTRLSPPAGSIRTRSLPGPRRSLRGEAAESRRERHPGGRPRDPCPVRAGAVGGVRLRSPHRGDREAQEGHGRTFEHRGRRPGEVGRFFRRAPRVSSLPHEPAGAASHPVHEPADGVEKTQRRDGRLQHVWSSIFITSAGGRFLTTRHRTGPNFFPGRQNDRRASYSPTVTAAPLAHIHRSAPRPRHRPFPRRRIRPPARVSTRRPGSRSRSGSRRCRCRSSGRGRREMPCCSSVPLICPNVSAQAEFEVERRDVPQEIGNQGQQPAVLRAACNAPAYNSARVTAEMAICPVCWMK